MPAWLPDIVHADPADAPAISAVIGRHVASGMLLPRTVPGKPLACVLWLPLLLPSRHAPAEGAFELVMLDVGQGLSVQVRTRTHSLLYDMGPAVPEGFDAGERAVVPVLHARGVRRLDRMMVSHADLDHIGGLDAVRREIRADALFAPDGAGVQDARPCLAGSSWSWDGVRFRVLHPPPYFPYLANEASCVLRIETRHGAVLLTGDIGEAIEAWLEECRLPWCGTKTASTRSAADCIATSRASMASPMSPVKRNAPCRVSIRSTQLASFAR